MGKRPNSPMLETYPVIILLAVFMLTSFPFCELHLHALAHGADSTFTAFQRGDVITHGLGIGCDEITFTRRDQTLNKRTVSDVVDEFADSTVTDLVAFISEVRRHLPIGDRSAFTNADFEPLNDNGQKDFTLIVSQRLGLFLEAVKYSFSKFIGLT